MRSLTWKIVAVLLAIAMSSAARPLEAQIDRASPRLASDAEDARLESLLAQGIGHYQAGAYRDAITNLDAVLVARPDVVAQLYVSLSYLAMGEDEMAQRHLVALSALPVPPLLREQVSAVLEVMQTGPVSPPMRRLIVAALERTAPVQQFSGRPVLADSILRRNFPYVP